MGGKIRRVDFSPAEWLEGTSELDNATRGLYITACALMWARGGPIDMDLLRAACRDHGHAFKRQFDLLVARGKLTINDGQIANKRAINELQNAEERSAKASQNGKRGNEINKLKPATRPLDSDANHQPSTISLPEEGSVSSDELTGADAPPPLAVVAGKDHRPPDPKRDLYAEGDRILGPKSGGQVTKLLKRHDGDIEATAYTLRKAATKHDPPAYVGAIVRGEKEPETDWDSFYRKMGIHPDGSSFGDSTWVPPHERPGDDGSGVLRSA